MVFGLREHGEKNISVVNCNPETVSTDYDICIDYTLKKFLMREF